MVNAHLENDVEVLIHHFTVLRSPLRLIITYTNLDRSNTIFRWNSLCIFELLMSSTKSIRIDYFSVTLQSQASNPLLAYLSISIPPLCHGILPNNLSPYTVEMVKGICPNVVEIEEPARDGFQLTLKLNLYQIPRNKGLFPVIYSLMYDFHILNLDFNRSGILHDSCRRLCQGYWGYFLGAIGYSEFTAERNIVECEFWWCVSGNVQTHQTSLSSERTLLCHQAGNSYVTKSSNFSWRMP